MNLAKIYKGKVSKISHTGQLKDQILIRSKLGIIKGKGNVHENEQTFKLSKV